MKSQITKFKRFYDLDKEIAYINDMNKEGWKLVFIRLGCFYTFVKTEPDEFITILHASKKEKISEITAFAAKCGYENVPHTLDGVGDLMYLTGKKSEVSDEFVSDNETKLEVNRIILNKFKRYSVLFTVLLAFLAVFLLLFSLIIGFYTVNYNTDLLKAEIIPMTVLFLLFVYLITRVVEVFRIKSKLTKKDIELKENLNIYE